ncbi:unnamed protein product [Urochloa humidicola]
MPSREPEMSLLRHRRRPASTRTGRGAHRRWHPPADDLHPARQICGGYGVSLDGSDVSPRQAFCGGYGVSLVGRDGGGRRGLSGSTGEKTGRRPRRKRRVSRGAPGVGRGGTGGGARGEPCPTSHRSSPPRRDGLRWRCRRRHSGGGE